MAETIALVTLVVKVKHMRALLFDMQCMQEQETMINSICVWVDNTAAIAVATGNDFTHETVKRVTVKVRFLQECVQKSNYHFCCRKTKQAEKRIALSFMINMLSQTNDKHGDKLLPEWVNHLAEVLTMTGE
jgi:hypothetical protein